METATGSAGTERFPGFVFQWHITDACDQRCSHCYIYAEDAGKAVCSMPWEQMQLTVENCMDFCRDNRQSPFFVLTGGDPLLHPDFWRLAELLRSLEVPFSILGNPFHLTARVCRRLKKLGCVRYQLSLDGLEETHDRLRKPGSYRETIRKIGMLNKAGLKSVVMTTVSCINIDEIPSLADEAVKAEAGLYTFARYCPAGADTENGISPRRYRELLMECAGKFRAYREAGCKTQFSKKDHLWTLLDYENGKFRLPEGESPDKVYGGCHCGQSHLTILPDGDVYACRRVPGSKVGNVMRDPLSYIWFVKMEAYRKLDRFEKCAKCELLRWCRGCPAVAASYGGDFYAPDPQCWKTAGQE